jgi:hypothetical protein
MLPLLLLLTRLWPMLFLWLALLEPQLLSFSLLFLASLLLLLILLLWKSLEPLLRLQVLLLPPSLLLTFPSAVAGVPILVNMPSVNGVSNSAGVPAVGVPC